MKPIINMDKEYGLVLEGGGAKGAYQVGAWKALREAGVKVSAVAGTSVGALNGALICMDDLERAEHLWNEIAYSKVMDVDDDRMSAIFENSLSLKETIKDLLTMLSDGGADVTPLKELIAENVDEDKIRASGKNFYILTFSLTDFKELDIDIHDIEDGLLPDLLLASAYIFPFFKNEKLHGKSYIDGGIFNNVPLASLVNRGHKDIIMIRIFGLGREKKVKLDDDVNLITIEPRVNLGNMMDFDSKKSRRNMKIGYYDGLRAIYGLKGRIYYIEQNGEEWYYLYQLLHVNESVKEYVMKSYKLHKEPERYTRNFIEVILPVLATEFKLGKNWNYEDVYLAILEATAKIFRIQKYKVYTGEELLQGIQRKAEKLTIDETFPPFVHIAVGMKGNIKKEEF